MTDHTPGPWIAYGTRVASEGRLVADAQQGFSNRVNEANARLIAAAPDLLLAAKVLLAHEGLVVALRPSGEGVDVVHMAAYALAKAGGVK